MIGLVGSWAACFFLFGFFQVKIFATGERSSKSFEGVQSDVENKIIFLGDYWCEAPGYEEITLFNILEEKESKKF